MTTDQTQPVPDRETDQPPRLDSAPEGSYELPDDEYKALLPCWLLPKRVFSVR